jgi:hypothetical protein
MTDLANTLSGQIKSVLSVFGLFAPLRLRNSALKEDGWFKSYHCSAPVDLQGNPLPWMPYPFIDFIAPRLTKEMDVFEFGSGNSTLFFSRRVKRLESVEHDIHWFAVMRTRIPSNVTLNHVAWSRGDVYSLAAANSGSIYDIVIVDGPDRVNCMKHSAEALKPGGIVVLDDAERKQYYGGIQYLREKGFNQIEFWGMAPGQLYKKCTVILYRPNNCIGI